MEGHYIRGTGDGSAKALDSIPFEILDGAAPAADEMLADQPETSDRMDRVIRLIEGYESTYGLELLATVHWASVRDEHGERRPEPIALDEAEGVISSWNRRKGQLFIHPHIVKARGQLERQGWLDRAQAPGLFADS